MQLHGPDQGVGTDAAATAESSEEDRWECPKYTLSPKGMLSV